MTELVDKEDSGKAWPGRWERWETKKRQAVRGGGEEVPPAEKLPGRSADSFTDCAPSRPPHFLYINTAARLDRARPPKPPSLPSDLSLLLSHSRTTATTAPTRLDSINSTDANHHSDLQSFQNNLRCTSPTSAQDASQEDRSRGRRHLQAQGGSLAPFLPGLSHPLRLGRNRIRN